MADIKIDEARAKIWISDVKNELELVETVLKNVTTSITTIPTDDDVIFKGIRKAGETLNNAWTKVCSVFKEVGNLVNDVVTRTTSTAEELHQEVESLNQRYSR